MDQVRFQQMQQEIEKLVLVSSILLIVYTTTGEATLGLPRLMDTLKNTVSVLLADMHTPWVSIWYPASYQLLSKLGLFASTLTWLNDEVAALGLVLQHVKSTFTNRLCRPRRQPMKSADLILAAFFFRSWWRTHTSIFKKKNLTCWLFNLIQSVETVSNMYIKQKIIGLWLLKPFSHFLFARSKVFWSGGGLSNDRGETVCGAECLSQPARLSSIISWPKAQYERTDLSYHADGQQSSQAHG